MQFIKQLLLIALVCLFACKTSRSDKDIETDVSVNVHPSAPNITVSVKNGTVFLSGLVSDSASYFKTIEATKSTDGVKNIDDKLHVAFPIPAN